MVYSIVLIILMSVGVRDLSSVILVFVLDCLQVLFVLCVTCTEGVLWLSFSFVFLPVLTPRNGAKAEPDVDQLGSC